jgi:hypothetical protein
MKTVKKLFNRKPQGGNTPKAKDPNAPTPGLEQAKTVFKALANVGDGAINVPGLKAAAQLVVQIIEVAQVSHSSDQLLLHIPFQGCVDRKSKTTKPTAPPSPNGHASLYRLQSTQLRESPNMRSMIV